VRPARLVTGVLTYAAAGAVLTVLIAWASALWLPDPKLGPVATSRAKASWVPAGHELENTFRGERFGATRWQIQGAPLDTARPVFDSFVTNAGSWGLPMRSVGYVKIYDARARTTRSPTWMRGVIMPVWVQSWAMKLSPKGTPYHGTLPLVPQWTGLVVDTAFWGLVAFGVAHMFVRWRGARRVRRGRCRVCGYYVSGLKACPECGDMP